MEAAEIEERAAFDAVDAFGADVEPGCDLCECFRVVGCAGIVREAVSVGEDESVALGEGFPQAVGGVAGDGIESGREEDFINCGFVGGWERRPLFPRKGAHQTERE